MSNEIRECKKCINTTANPSITIGEDGLCNVCRDYSKKFNQETLDNELEFLKTLIKNEKYIVPGILMIGGSSYYPAKSRRR